MARYQITGIGVYKHFLALNPMMGNSENRQEFGPFNTLDELKAFYNAEKVEPYSDEGPNMFAFGAGDPGTKTYRKCFRKGGPLEWMNPLEEHEWAQHGIFGHGVFEVLVSVEHVNRGVKLSDV